MAAQRTQVVVTHSRVLPEFLAADATRLELVKQEGETRVAGQGLLDVLA